MAGTERPDVIGGLHGRYQIDRRILAHGGRATLHAVVDGALPLVYKAFKQPLDDHGDRARLGRLVSEGRAQFVQRQRRLGSTPGAALNWPIDLVVDGPMVRGVVLPRVPPRYERPNGSLRSMEFLILHRGEVPTAAERVSVLIRLAELMAWLAARQLVHGDLAPRNVLWSREPAAEVVLLDVDGIHDAVALASEHVATPGWTDPRVLERLTDKHDLLSDRYALGLFMYRGLLVTPGMLRKGPSGWRTPTLPPGFPPRLGGLISRGLDPFAAERRPAPGEWVDALLAEFFPSGAPNWHAFGRLEEITELRRSQDRRVTGRPLTPTPVPAPRADATRPKRLRRLLARS